jgi:hypothetical protein
MMVAILGLKLIMSIAICVPMSSWMIADRNLNNLRVSSVTSSAKSTRMDCCEILSVIVMKVIGSCLLISDTGMGQASTGQLSGRI